MRTTSRFRLALPIAVLAVIASVLVSACSTFVGPAWQVGDVSMSVEDFMVAFEQDQATTGATTSTSTERIPTADLATFMTGQIQDELIAQGLGEKGLTVTQEDRDNAELAFQQQGATSAPSDRDIELQATSVVLGTKLMTDAIDQGQFDIDALAREAFDAEKDNLSTPPQTCAHVVLVRAGGEAATAEPTEDDYAAAQAEAEAVAARLTTEDFTTVANDVMSPQDLEQQPGGDIGCFAVADMNPELTAIIEPLEPGEISAPTRFEPFGSIIVKVDSRSTEPSPAKYEDFQDQATKLVVQQLTSKLVNDYIKELGAGTFVQVDPRFGSWSAETFSVVPPDGAATPTVPTTAVDPSNLDLSELGIDPSQIDPSQVDPSQVDPSQVDPSSTTPGS